MTKIIRITAIAIIFLFSFLGILIFQALIHELSHKADLKNVAVNGTICLLNYPKSFLDIYGYYDYKYSDTAKEEKIMKYTEYKAYFISFILILIYVTCIYIILAPQKEKFSEDSIQKHKQALYQEQM